MKNRLIALTSSLLILLSTTFICLQPAFSDTDNHDRSTEEVIDEILDEQGVSSTEDIDCGDVSDTEFEALGEAVMGVMHPNDEEHELMDNMMGGEGSESLESMHISMGRQYLGCWVGSFGMMGGGSSMMGSWNNGFDFNWWMVVPFMFMIGTPIVLVILGVMILGPKKKSENTALEVLKKRYAKGEISKTKFEDMKKELN